MQIRSMTRCALFAGLIAVCAWLAIPIGEGAVTLQTLGIYLALGLLGGRRGSVSILVYLCLGAVGLPVFTGFQGGIGILLGVTGGFLWGFLAAGAVYRLLEDRSPLWVRLVLCQLICYGFGVFWSQTAYGVGIWTLLPYLLPDVLKLILALLLIKKLKPVLNQ